MKSLTSSRSLSATSVLISGFTVSEYLAQAELIQLQVYVVKNMEAITITCTNLAGRFDQTRPMFLEALNQFRLQ